VLTPAEEQLLHQALSHERMCIAKYRTYAEQVTDPELKPLFQQLAQAEEQHANTITSLLQAHMARIP